MYPPNVACPDRTTGAAKTANTATATPMAHGSVTLVRGRPSANPATAAARTSQGAARAVAWLVVASVATTITAARPVGTSRTPGSGRSTRSTSSPQPRQSPARTRGNATQATTRSTTREILTYRLAVPACDDRFVHDC